MFKAIFFGSPQIHHNQNVLTGMLSGRSFALFVYLAMTDQPQDRGHLADLLWWEIGEQQARQNLRYVLYDLRKLMGDYLVVTRNTLTFAYQKPHWIDARVFTTSLAQDETATNPALLQGVLELYRAEFLAGFSVQNAPGFEEWLLQQRQQFHNQAIQGLLLLSEHCLTHGDYASGLTATRRLLQLEPWQEEAHRHQMRLLAYNGQRLDALAQYATCRQVLQTEFGVEPEDATTDLFHAIEAGTLAPPVRSSGVLPFPSPQINWDAIPQVCHLVGRNPELSQLHHWVTDTQHRAIGLFGLAGQGKSALSAELVTHLAEASASVSPSSAIEVIIWSTLITFPTLSHLLHEWLLQLTKPARHGVNRILAPGQTAPTAAPVEPLETLLQRLLVQLRRRRVLLIVDGGETLYGSSGPLADYQPGWAAFDELVRRLADNEHRSCLLFLSRITPVSWAPLARRCSAVRTLILGGLTPDESVELLQVGGDCSASTLLPVLAKRCAGHPHTLLAVRELLSTFGSEILTSSLEEFCLASTFLRTLQTHFARLTALEQRILLHLTLLPMPPTAATLWPQLPHTGTPVTYLEALQTLQRCHWLLPNRPGGALLLSPLVRRFIEQQLRDTPAQDGAQNLLPIHAQGAALRLRRQVGVEPEWLPQPEVGKAAQTEAMASIHHFIVHPTFHLTLYENIVRSEHLSPIRFGVNNCANVHAES